MTVIRYVQKIITSLFALTLLFGCNHDASSPSLKLLINGSADEATQTRNQQTNLQVLLFDNEAQDYFDVPLSDVELEYDEHVLDIQKALGLVTVKNTDQPPQQTKVVARYKGMVSNSVTVSIVPDFNGTVNVVNPGNVTTLLVGATIQLSSQLLHTDGSVESNPENVQWSVCDDDCASTRAIATRATVNSTGLVTFLESGDVTVRASYGTKYDDVKFFVESSDIESLITSVVDSSTSLIVGQKARLKTMATYNNGRSEEVVVSYQSNNPAISITSEEGAFFARAVAEDDAEVIAKLGTVESAPVYFSVMAPSVDNLSATYDITGGGGKLLVGNTASLNVMASLSDGTSRNVTDLVTWVNTDNPNSISIQGSVATAVEAGNSNWKAQYKGKEALLTFTVDNVSYRSLDFLLGTNTVDKYTFKVDDEITLMLVGISDSNALVPLNLANVKLKWEAIEDNASIRTVIEGQQLKVTAVSEGTGRLIAEYQGVKSTLNLTLNPKLEIKALGISAKNRTISVTESTAFSSSILYDNDFNQSLDTSKVIWSVDPSNVAMISNEGVLTGLSEGQVEVTGRYQTFEATYLLDVTPQLAEVVRIEMDSKDYTNFTQYELFRFDPIAVRSDGSTFDVDVKEVLVHDPNNVLRSQTNHDVITDERLSTYFLDKVNEATTVTVSWNGHQVEQEVKATTPLDEQNVTLTNCPSVLRAGEVSAQGCRLEQDNGGNIVNLVMSNVYTNSPDLIGRLRPTGLTGYKPLTKRGAPLLSDISTQLSPNFVNNFVDGAKFNLNVCLPSPSNQCFEHEITASSGERPWGGFSRACWSTGTASGVDLINHDVKVGEEALFTVFVSSDGLCTARAADMSLTHFEQNMDIGVVERDTPLVWVSGIPRNNRFTAIKAGVATVSFTALRNDGKTDTVTHTFNVTN